MGRSFAGEPATDNIIWTQNALFNNIHPLSVFARFTINGYNADGTGARIYTKGDTVGVGHSHLTFYFDGVNNWAQFNADLWSTTIGQWQIAGPSTGVAHTLLVTYNYNATTDVPVFYLDGVNTALGAGTVNPAGTLTFSETNDLIIGNRPTNNRPWNGILSEIAFWQAILTSTDAANLNSGMNPLRVNRSNLKWYAQLWGTNSPELDSVNGLTGTVTNAAKAAHPKAAPQLFVVPRLDGLGAGGRFPAALAA